MLLEWRQVQRHSRNQFLLATCVSVCAAIGLTRPWSRESEDVGGAMLHDFGEQVLIQPIELEHVFELTNRSGVTLHVERVATTCGCTRATVSKLTIPPGHDFQVAATLKLGGAGEKREEVRLICGEIEPVILTLRASARTVESFYTVARSVFLPPAKKARVMAVELQRDSSMPAPLRFETPGGIRVNASEWTQVLCADIARQQPSRWHSWIEIENTTDAMLDGGTVIVKDGLGRVDRIRLDGRPGD